MTDESISKVRGRAGRSGSWVAGLVLVLLGLVFLLQNAGLLSLVGNWWALFILIPAVISLFNAWRTFQEAGRFTHATAGLVTGGLVTLTVALIFLLELSWSTFWPVILIIAGVGALLSGMARDYQPPA